jgi:alkylation response protein AidB-like acyl-CoA dehydrogenase
MSQAINWYKADLRDIYFLLFEQFQVQNLLGKGTFANWERDDVEMIIAEVYKWSREVLGPINREGDAHACVLSDGKVHVPPSFKQAWQSLYEAGWRSLLIPAEYGGQDAPFVLHNVTEELMSGANTAFNMYPALTQGVGLVIHDHGTPEQRARYCQKLFDGSWSGTMCLTESHAGSDVGASTTRATPLGDGRYKLEGTKIYISGGDHDMCENIVHLVLARTEDAPAGTKGLSLFIVPRDRLDGSGNNDVSTTGIEHKLGIRGSSTCTLRFGERGECIGELMGTEEQRGMRQMFQLMNQARIEVGLLAVAVAGSAYLNALSYAKERRQGTSIDQWKDPNAPRVAIIEHADVRRMLLDMKAKVEGMRALIFKLTAHGDTVRALGDSDPTASAYHQGQVDLLVPLVKSYTSDRAFEICASAVQVMGGAGYLVDHPIEQYLRDAKIFSIYEGTNHIQALDLVGRKLGQKGGANFQAFMKDVLGFAAQHKQHPVLGECVQTLDKAANALTGCAMCFLKWSRGGNMELVPREANRFLDIMAEVTIGWLLLEGAVIAHEKAEALPDDHADKLFYQGRVYSSLYFCKNILTLVEPKAALLRSEERSVLDIPKAAFATLQD